MLTSAVGRRQFGSYLLHMKEQEVRASPAAGLKGLSSALLFPCPIPMYSGGIQLPVYLVHYKAQITFLNTLVAPGFDIFITSKSEMGHNIFRAPMFVLQKQPDTHYSNLKGFDCS